jgi:hypothetical protein
MSNEMIPEFRKLLEAAEHLQHRRREFHNVTAGDWRQFEKEIEHARKFLQTEIDGPKAVITNSGCGCSSAGMCFQHLKGE